MNTKATEKKEVKVLKVELVSPVVLSERGNDSDVVVRINGNDYKAAIRSRYADGKNYYEVYVDRMEKSTLENLGVELDTTVVVTAHTALVEKREAAKKAAADADATSRYNNWAKLAKAYGCKVNYTLAEFLAKPSYDRRWLTMSSTEAYKNQKIEVTIRKEDAWFEVETGYDRDQKRRTKHIAKLTELISDLTTKAKSKIDAQLARVASLKTGLAQVQATFGEDVHQGEHGYYAGNHSWRSENVYEVAPKGDVWSAPKIQFQRTSDGKATTYNIKKIEGYYTEAEMKKILDVVRNAKVQK